MLASTACTSPSAPTTPDSSSISAGLTLCVDETNRYRAGVGLPALARSSALEAFAAQAIQHDHGVSVPHQHFLQTNGGDGLARAENQLLRWRGYTLEQVIKRGLANMWAEGPGGTHYDTLTGNYSEVGCGVFADGDGISVSQDFR